MKRTIAIITALAIAPMVSRAADSLKINSFHYTAPVKVQMPHIIDTVDNTGAKFELKSILEAPMSLLGLKDAPVVSALPKADAGHISLASFYLETTGFAKGSLAISGIADRKVYLDGKPLSGTDLTLEPGTHEVALKYIGSDSDSAPKVSVAVDKGKVTLRTAPGRIYDLNINTYGPAAGGVTISPSGKLLALRHSVTDQNGKSSSYTDIIRLSDQQVIARTDKSVSWMSSTDEYYFTRNTATGRELIVEDPVTNSERVLCKDLPDGYYTLSPSEDFLIYSITKEGPKEGEVHQVINPEDRQPGYRDRSYLAKYDLRTGIMQPLTFGYHNSYLSDISLDGKKILFMTMENNFTQRPTSLYSLYTMDMETLEVKPVYEKDGFASSATFSPDAGQVAVLGSPEAFGGIGMVLPQGRTPNMYDYQLFIIDLATNKVNPITKKFDPSVQSFEWSRSDGKIYLMAEDKDCKNLFRIDPKSGKSERLPNTEEYITAYNHAADQPSLVYIGESLSNYRRVYVMDTKTMKQKLIYDFTPDRLGGVDLGQGYGYEFKSSRGDMITGFYVLPPDFDPSKKYPMIVHYYGGCSPTYRYCLGSYSPQLYAAQGYIFFAINPSGASGFGQEFASRHVNTAGDGVADDIIEGTKAFCKDHPWVDADHIGCFSASYGGFMTQLLLTKTDIYATGISHAGISDHTSYWGEGYWGYSYSEVSMANSYPWTRKDLYVDRSTLFNADKINTPILFVHGSADTNVPIGESIQMFTALQLLGRESAFVVVDGEDHHVADFNKNRQWLRTMSAWFAKYLKEDSSWWDELYPEKHL